jgi:hypothetical protein
LNTRVTLSPRVTRLLGHVLARILSHILFAAPL